MFNAGMFFNKFNSDIFIYLHNDSVTVSYIVLFYYYTISNCVNTLIAINVITIVDCTPVHVVFDYRT